MTRNTKALAVALLAAGFATLMAQGMSPRGVMIYLALMVFAFAFLFAREKLDG